MAQLVKNLPAMQKTQVQSLGREGPLEEGMATHSSICAWRIPRTEELAGYSPWGCKESDTTEGLTLSFFLIGNLSLSPLNQNRIRLLLMEGKAPCSAPSIIFQTRKLRPSGKCPMAG